MFANPTKVGISQRVVATLVAFAVTLLFIGVHAFTAKAADLPNISDTISDSDPSALPSHTIEFDIPTGSSVVDGNNITITFDSADDGAGGQDFAGIGAVLIGDLSANVTGAGDATDFAFVSANADSFTVNGIDASAGDTVEIVVAADVITNPSTVDSYEIEVDIANATTDSGKTRIAIVNNVLVSAIVDTIFDFTITGNATSTATNGTSTTGSTSDTAINFGTIVANGVYNMAQTLNVQTNARNGFVVTVESDSYLQSANGAIIDDFDDGTDVAVPGTAWSSPQNSIASDLTWGHWGMRTDDADIGTLGGFYGGVNFGADEFIAVSSTTPRQVFHHDGPSNGVDANIGEIDVLYRLEITPLQEAADDYNTTLTYIATPTF